jgi:hypothetical protein
MHLHSPTTEEDEESTASELQQRFPDCSRLFDAAAHVGILAHLALSPPILPKSGNFKNHLALYHVELVH